MRSLLFLPAIVLAASSCAWRRLAPGPSGAGEIVRVSSRQPPAARRQAVEAMLPFFFSEQGRVEKAAALEETIFSHPERFTARERLSGRSEPVVEVRLDALASALEKARLLRPAGFASGPAKVLLALSEPDGGLGVGLAADSLRRALISRGVSAADARDPLNPARFKAKTADEAVAEAAAGGVDWLVLGRAGVAVEPDAPSGAWRASARLDMNLYATAGSTEPLAAAARGSVVDVSSSAALGRAFEQAGEEASALVASRVGKARAGRSEYSVLCLPPRDAVKLRALVSALRRIEGVQAAVLGAWSGPEDGALLRVFALGLSLEELGARLLRSDPSLRIVGVEPGSGLLTLEPAVEWGN